MLNPRSYRIAIIVCLREAPSLKHFFRLNRKRNRHISMLLQRVIHKMNPSQITSAAMSRYPWCFIAPDKTLGTTHYFVGAFLPPQKETDDTFEVLYAYVNEPWLMAHLQSPVGLPLWLSRALIPLINNSTHRARHRDIRRICSFLERLLNPFKCLNTQCTNHLEIPQLEKLSEVCCEADEELLSEYGVDAMPWMGWPGCIGHIEAIWIWRQSRHGKVIESQKVLLKGIHV